MKKYILIASAALLTLASCTKVMETAANSDEIGFQVANYAQTKADGDATPTVAFTHDDFGAYAWHNGDQGAQTVRFSNEKVAKRDGVWTTVNATYYWMKTGTDDFVCYAPYNEGTPEVTPTSIKWGVAAPYEVKMDSKDLMYADKALNQTGKVGQDGKTAAPVPVLFHHALAKLAFQVKANFLEYTNPEEKDDKGNVVVASGKTTWEVTLRSAKLSGIRNKGSIELKTPDASGKWTLPEGKVWTPDSGNSVLEAVELVSGEEGLKLTTEPLALYAGTDGKAQSFYVLPQALGTSTEALAAQQLTVDIHIKTTLPTLDEKGQPRVFEEDYKATLDLSGISSLKAWQMNQNILYTIRIKPTSAVDPENPDDPSDVTVTFDPAVSDWDDLSADATIQL
jgi:hypothetical protein